MFSKRLSVVIFLIVGILLAIPVSAHTPMLYVEDLYDGTIYLEGGFSNGSSASGVEILLVEASEYSGSEKVELFEGKKILLKTELDEFGEAVLEKPEVSYLVVFNGGPGHTIIKEGPQ